MPAARTRWQLRPLRTISGRPLGAALCTCRLTTAESTSSSSPVTKRAMSKPCPPRFKSAPLRDGRHGFDGKAFALTAEFRQESPGGKDTNRVVLAQRQQVLVAGYDNLGIDRDGGCDDVVVIGIAADGPISGGGAASSLPISSNSAHHPI